MKTVSFGQVGVVQFDAGWLTLSLPARAMSPYLWDLFKGWFQGEHGQAHWLSAPFRIMTMEEDVPGYPRWKQVSVDVLSWLVFRLLVRPEQQLVRLWQTIEWSEINRLCAPLYKNSKSGQRAWAPAQLFALLVLYFVEPAASECGLLRNVAATPLYRWFCGFGLFTELPDHSTLYTFRQRLGVDRFEAIFSRVVARCLDAGLIANELVHFDMTGVAASARHWTPYERAVLLTLALLRYWDNVEAGHSPDRPMSEALGKLVAEIAIAVLGNSRLQKDAKAPSRVLKSVERWKRHQQQTKGQALWDLSLEEAVQLLAEAGHLEESSLPQQEAAQRHWLKKTAQFLKDLLPHARGDLDARVGWVNNVRLVCGYWLGFLIDNKQGVITAVQTVPLNKVQHEQMMPALETHRDRLTAYPKAVAADSAQDYYLVHQALDKLELEGHIASRSYYPPGNGLPPDCFTWQDEQLYCPEGKILQPGKLHKDGRRFFRAQQADCVSCPRRESCLPKGQQPDGPRRIHLNPAAHQRWWQNREHTRTEAYKAAQKRRFAFEGWFGLAKRLHRADKMPYRSALMNQIAGLMIGTSMNLGLLARQG